MALARRFSTALTPGPSPGGRGEIGGSHLPPACTEPHESPGQQDRHGQEQQEHPGREEMVHRVQRHGRGRSAGRVANTGPSSAPPATAAKPTASGPSARNAPQPGLPAPVRRAFRRMPKPPAASARRRRTESVAGSSSNSQVAPSRCTCRIECITTLEPSAVASMPSRLAMPASRSGSGRGRSWEHAVWLSIELQCQSLGEQDHAGRHRAGGQPVGPAAAKRQQAERQSQARSIAGPPDRATRHTRRPAAAGQGRCVCGRACGSRQRLLRLVASACPAAPRRRQRSASHAQGLAG